MAAILQRRLNLGGVVHREHSLWKSEQSLDPHNGRSSRFWSDNWSPFSNIRRYLELPPSTSLGIRPTTTLADLHRQDRWALPQPRSEAMLNIHVFLSSITLSEEPDEFVWSPLGTPLSSFSKGMIYNAIKHHEQKVAWSKIVWSSRSIPRHNFLTWLIVLNRSPTKDRMINWGLQSDPACGLCTGFAETRDHLYF